VSDGLFLPAWVPDLKFVKEPRVPLMLSSS